MKRIFTLSVLLLAFFAGMSAQEKKGWLFYEGLSDETVANLNADTGQWADNGNTDGVIYNWKNIGKQSADSYWMANGEVIEELRGLLIDIGSNKDNSIHLQTERNGGDGKVRLTRKNTKITFPKLANGQTITIQGRSANSTATNRGIAPVQNYIQFQAEESSPQTNGACIFLGSQVEGSEGTYTFKWKVVTDEPDSVDVQFTLTPDAGIDFTYFMIDNGDAPDVNEALPVGYLYAGSLDEDYAYAYLSGSEKFALTEIDVTSTEATTDSLRQFQAIVISPTITATTPDASTSGKATTPDASTSGYLPVIKQTIAYVPVLNLNPNIYEALGYGKAVASNSGAMDLLDPAFEGFASLFEEETPIIELITDGNITGVELGEYFAADKVLATAGDRAEGITAMHIHNAKRNAYVLLPLPIESMAVANQDVIATLIPQTLLAVTETKKDITAVGTPVITPKQENGYTVVSLSAANSTAIFYTIDGSDPTAESTRYTEPFTLTEAATVKAFAIGDGYSDSKVAEKAIVIMVQAAQPVVSISREEGKSIVTLSAAVPAASPSEPAVTTYFSFNGVTTSADMQAYTEPIELTEPATITAIVEGGGFLPSEAVKQFIGINGIDATNIRLDTLSHFNANEADWFVDNSENGGEGKASAYYYWGKNAWNYYSDEVDYTETLKDSEGNDSIVTYYKPDPDALRVITPLNDNGWVLKSQGQVLTGELQLSYENAVGNGRANRYAEEAIDFITTPNKGAITFGGKGSGDPYSARIETTAKLAGPFDVIVFCGNGNGSGYGVLEVQTSVDGDNWTKIDTLKMASTQRYIKRTRVSYNETEPVYVRVAQTGGGTKAQVYDILVMNNGELSKQYDEQKLTGISDTTRQVAAAAGIYSIGGQRQQQMRRGLNIIVTADGKVRKVMR